MATPENAQTYSYPVVFVFVFNLIVGTGALSMPKAFQDAGWLLSLIVILLLAFISYMTVTFMIESLAVANEIHKYEEKERRDKRSSLLSYHPDIMPSTGHIMSANTTQAPEEVGRREQTSSFKFSRPSFPALHSVNSPHTVGTEGPPPYTASQDYHQIRSLGPPAQDLTQQSSTNHSQLPPPSCITSHHPSFLLSLPSSKPTMTGSKTPQSKLSHRRSHSTGHSTVPTITPHARAKLRLATLSQSIEALNTSDNTNFDTEPLLLHPFSGPPETHFDIDRKIEMGQLASLFLNPFGTICFYISICLYLYGDLAIYAVVIPRSIRDVTCHNMTGAEYLDNDDECWHDTGISRFNAYRIYLAVFYLIFAPFAFFDVSKTKYLQIITTIIRWTAMLIMIILAVIKLGRGWGHSSPRAVRIEGLPNLFGVCTYAFMCHHSLPTLLAPLKDKSKAKYVILGDYTFILLFYSLLSFTALFTFSELRDIYTENFIENTDPIHPVTKVVPIKYFLGLFPALVLCTNFPIISVVLRNNLKFLFRLIRDAWRERQGLELEDWFLLTSEVVGSVRRDKALSRIVFPLVAIVPPLIIAIFTDNVEMLIGITGNYAGAFIEFAFPALFVYFARKKVIKLFGPYAVNSYATRFFARPHFVYLALVWTVVTIVLVTINRLISA